MKNQAGKEISLLGERRLKIPENCPLLPDPNPTLALRCLSLPRDFLSFSNKRQSFRQRAALQY